MPIQWSGRLTSVRQLASVIQGEASSPDGQFAVASVMYNRMTTPGGYLGGGSGDISSVVTPTQFNGYNSNPSPNAMSLAQALWNGEPPPGGDPGNATFFAAPSSANAAWANPNTAAGSAFFNSAENVGGNYYSDRLGPPSDGFRAPAYGENNVQMNVQTQADNYDHSPYGSLSTLDGYNPSGSNAFGIDGPNYAAAGGDAANPVSPSNPGDVSGMIGQGPQSGLQALFATNTSPQAVNSNPAWNTGGPPVEITNISAAGEIGAKAIQKGLDANAQAVSTSTQAAVQAGQGWLDTIRQAGTDALVRGGLILLALAVLTGAWFFYSADKGHVEIRLPA